jgi:hypothetical protein
MFLLDEDKALRQKLQGIVVEDQKTGGAPSRTVGVWFGQPDQEIRAQSYPYITIDMIGVTREVDREMRGLVSPDYLAPEGYDPATSGWSIQMPIPVMIDYQITTYARHPRHDRAIISQLLHNNLLLRFGYLEVPYTKTNGDSAVVFRRLDISDIAKRDVTEQAKRLFVNAITVRVSSEIVQGTIDTLYKVNQIHVTNVLDVHAGTRPGDPTFVGPGEFTISA